MDPKRPLSKSSPGERERAGQIQLGVAFRNLNIYGSASLNHYQHTAASYLLHVPMFLVCLFRQRENHKSHILRDFGRLVRSDEMLLVLGRPGSGCPTPLKVLAGETRGLDIDDVAKINYDGKRGFNGIEYLMRRLLSLIVRHIIFRNA